MNNLAQKIPDLTKTPTYFVNDCNPNSMSVNSVSRKDVVKIVASLKSASEGWDGISLIIVKSSFNSIVDPLTHCMNISLMNGIAPDGMASL